ncbi:DUF2225 domain-containing protein [Tepidibacter hydrothermalis]|uniref:DUF2225 domain-containing protein n=1 Tax=Tepidibacter hydrothermalis TaxID=3036126 RepID=A0ABY8EFE5_9FIRM|nr:DUF2225 domain-containing protein [Tepidibacter hydrothermalis]WFD09555.1 DUF2225 domain-containing protein [Tepidibacter hydrothermalis]
MDKELYDKKVKCPICKNEFTTKKVKTSALRIDKRETDLYVHYKTVNPYLYSVWVCPKCGYAAMESKFNNIKKYHHSIIAENITSLWKPKDYGKKRNIYEAIQTHKLAIHEGNVLNWEKSYIGGLSLRLSWLYRLKGDKELEIKFQKYALIIFTDCFSKEVFPMAGMDSASMAYLIGELNRRFQNYEDSIKWFQIALKDPNIKRKRIVENMVRNQWSIAIEEYKEFKQSDSENEQCDEEFDDKSNNIKENGEKDKKNEKKQKERTEIESNSNGNRGSKIRKKLFFRGAL